MRHLLALIFIMLSLAPVQAQISALWTDKDESEMRRAQERVIIPDRYRTVGLNIESARSFLALAPSETEVPPSQSAIIIDLPTPDGAFERFRIVEYDMMEPGLAERYPEIKTYRGISLDNPFRTVRIAWTARGLSAMVSGSGAKYFIDPFARHNQQDYIVYNKSDYTGPGSIFTCMVESERQEDQHHSSQRLSGDCTFRSYRLAVAATGEYSNFHDAFSSADSDTVLAAIVIAVNRVNEVYERDLAIRLILIANTDDVFYYIPGSDPYSGGACTQLTQNQTTMDNVIGSANYDVGHVFSVGSGGCASLNVPCTGNKARGATGLNPPINDPFYIDYVAHELGHQFGGNHCFNNSCSGNRNNSTAYEPGSGATIMAYAGICSPNVQDNSDDYFHGISVQEINNFTSNGNGDICDQPILPWTNTAPIIVPGVDYTIPISTPFMLTADASDANGDPLNYLWEQWDQEIGGMPPSASNTIGPMFRSFDPSASPTRYFPMLDNIVNNTTSTWEVLPSVTRNMDFRVTVKDFHNGLVGCADEDNINVNTTATAGPFLVTNPNTSVIQWTEGQTETVSWNVAGTNTGLVNCANVDILLSYDGGYTWDDTIATGMPNTGTASVIVPAGITTTARVMVKCSDNVFFDISNQDFEILSGIPDYNLASIPPVLSVCQPDDAVYTIQVSSINGYADNVTLSLTGSPAGSIFSFSTNPVVPGNNTTLTLSNLGVVSLGDYVMTLSGASTSGPKSISINLEIVSTLAVVTQTAPVDQANEVDLLPTFVWVDDPSATSFDIQVATDAGFTNIVIDESSSAATYTATTILDGFTTYYWRVRPTNICATGPWSSTWEFETLPCFIYVSSDVPKSISSSGTPTITSDLEIFDSGVISDVNVIELYGTHTWMGDLVFTLTSPANTDVLLIDGICGNNNNFDVNLDDEAAPGSIPCPPTDGGTYQPTQLLSAFDGESVTGTWELEVDDQANQDGGALANWALQICMVGFECNSVVFNVNDNGPGSLRGAVACATDGDTITFDASVHASTIVLSSTLVIDKDVYIQSSVGEQVTVSGAGLVRPFSILSNTQAEMNGLIILAGSGPDGGAIQNAGTLLLRDITVLPSGGLPANSLVDNTGTLTLEGTCNIQQ